jgi:hypothetical protein
MPCARQSNRLVAESRAGQFRRRSSQRFCSLHSPHECNRNGVRELDIEQPRSYVLSRGNVGTPVVTSLEKVMGGMLHGSALEALRFSGSVRYRDNTDRLGVAGLFRGLMEPTVNLATKAGDAGWRRCQGSCQFPFGSKSSKSCYFELGADA